MGKDFLQYMLLICWAIVIWWWGRFWHQPGTKSYPQLMHFIKAPAWLNFLCGNPRSDGYLEIAGIVFQIAIILDLLLIPMFLAFSVEYKRRGLIFLGVQSMAIVLAAMVRIMVILWRRLNK